MLRMFFTIKRENKGRLIELIKNKIKSLDTTKLGLNDFKVYEHENDILTISYNLNVDLSENNIEKFTLIMKGVSGIGIIIKLHSVTTNKKGEYIHYNEIFYCNPKKEKEFDNLRFEELMPDHKEKINDGYFLVFKFKLKDKPDQLEPDNYLSLHTTIQVRYIGTNKQKEAGLVIYSKKENKKHCDRLVIGKAFEGIESGVIINDEPDILAALNKADILLKKRGMEVIDLQKKYVKILSQLKENED